MIPLRSLFRNRWMALAWCFSICCTAVHFAGDQRTTLDAANSAGGDAAQSSALAAEDD